MYILNNFQDIGFSVENVDQLRDLCFCLGKESSYVSAGSAAAYHLYSTPEGVAVWSKITEDGRITSTTPFFNGTSQYSVVVEKKINDAISGLYVHAKNAANNVSFAVQIPDYEMKASTLNFPSEVELQITAFGQKLQLFDSEKRLKNSKYRGLKAEGSFVTKDEIGSADNGIEPVAVISGKILKLNTVVNPFSGITFYAMQLKTAGGVIDLVCSKNNINHEPCVAAILVGTVYLTARVMRTKRRSEIITGVDVSRFSAMATIRETYERYVAGESYAKRVANSYQIPPLKRFLSFALICTIVAAPIGSLILLKAIKERNRQIRSAIDAELRLARVARPIMTFLLRLGKPNGHVLPALAIGSFADIEEDQLMEIAQKFKTGSGAREEETNFIKSIINDKSFVKDRRRKLPECFSNNDIYVFDVQLHYSPKHKVEEYPNIIACVATEGNFGKIRYVPRSVIKKVVEMTNRAS